MPIWVKGNQCFMITTNAYDVGGSPNPIMFNFLIPFTLVKPTGAAQKTLIWQPGIVRGFNMYVGQNTCNRDVTLSLNHGKWNGDKSHPVTATVLFTIPAGETGHFCMNPNLIPESVRTWQSRDEMQFEIAVVGGTPTGNVEKLTFGVCLEITEEYMLDNDYPPNL